MGAYVWTTDVNSKQFVFKKSDIRRVYKGPTHTIISFKGAKKNPVNVHLTPHECHAHFNLTSHLCLTDKDGAQYVVKLSDVSRVHHVNGTVIVFSVPTVNTPIRMSESVHDVFKLYLEC